MRGFSRGIQTPHSSFAFASYLALPASLVAQLVTPKMMESHPKSHEPCVCCHPETDFHFEQS